MPKSAKKPAEDLEESGWERRKREKTDQIVEAATQLFLAHGFAGVSMDNVVEVAGVSKRTLYNYYESKEQLFIDVMHAQLARFWPALDVPAAIGENAAHQLLGSAVEILRLAMSETPLALYRIVIAESHRFPELAGRFYEFSSIQVINRVSDMLQLIHEQSSLNISDARQAAEHFLDLLIGTAFMRVVLGIDPAMTDKKIRQHASNAVTVFMRAYSS